jgi:hypothetical protein
MGTWGWHRFGGDLSGRRALRGLTVPTTGRIGWHHGLYPMEHRGVLPLPDHEPGPVATI